MRAFFILAIVVVAVYAVDYAAILQDETRLKAAVDCLLDRGPCVEVQELKDKFPQLVATDCGSCTPEQKIRFEIAKKIIQDNYPADFEALKAKYLPSS
ncbi:allergen Tha p 1 [Galleria mellonella]|uniref:Allergen Tha p 1-like n=1 Tax=Galleria mellonella TaxID=7137 RepID=A0A5C0E4B2_GALME|nr:allergen Tha p 1 [Galleria mellonella]XP_026763007.1 allergen Tha p 1 [Galleria mellonella]QEI46800.1 chemosensory protein 2 [Galleria mellonella]